MSHSDYVHLHVHTQYSLLDGACRIKDLVAKAVEYNMPAIGMTDHGNMFGAVDFYQTAVSMGIKPVIGVEAYMLNKGSRLDRNPRQKSDLSHLVMFAKDNTGYKNLLKLVSSGYLEGFFEHPRMDKDILSQHAGGIVCTSACLRGEVPSNILQGNYHAALKAADDYRHIFGQGNFYLELMDHGMPEQRRINEGLKKISEELNLPMVVTNDIHYIDQYQSTAHDALLCIQTQTTVGKTDRMRMPSDQFYFKDPLKMRSAFEWAPQALTNTVEIAEKCNVEFDFKKFHLPRFDPPGGQSKEDYLRTLCVEGVTRRFGQINDEIQKRLDYELDIIDKMGFVSYFLIVWDFINYAKNEGIPVGPGRGSAAGSLVSYLLGITDLDPLHYGLLFERFLNPDRAGMPDIDIDFCFERRAEVIEYVSRKYGAKNVAQIITFGTMQAKAAIRDVGRALGASYGDVDRLAKLVPNELGITLEDALTKEPQLKLLCEEDRSAADIISTARVLEGLNRHASTHAAGVVIGDRPLDEYVPLFKTSEGQITTGFTMNGIAKIGLLKMDFLGLRTLTVISEALQLIKNDYDIDLDIGSIPLDDKKTYENLSKAHSFGVFQLESSGMRDLLKKIKPSVFEDLISVLALYRPGPMGSGMLDDFIKRKRGDVEIKYDHPKLEPILKETYGIIVYQEQVMKIPVALAGFTLVHADHLRRAMSKKIASVMDQMRRDFVSGCKEHSQMDEKQSNKIFDLIDYFSGYGFNRSHSAAYAMITYRTAYLKANFPVEFMSALLNSEKNNTEKIVEYVKECASMGIHVLPPNLQESYKSFKVIDKKTIRYGMLAIKNVGSSAIDSIVGKRSDGPYTSLNDLCERVDLRLVNRKVLESLIKCGAMDGFQNKRSQLMASVERSLETGAKTQKEKVSGQVSFFDTADDLGGFQKDAASMPDIKEWPQTQLLAYEKAILGFYISGHPLSHYQVEIKEFTDFSTRTLKKAAEGEEVRLVGLIEHVKLTNTRRTNERMAITRMEDMDGEVEVLVFPSVYPDLSQYLREGEVVFLKGKVSFRDDEPKIIAGDMQHIHDVYSSIQSIHIDLTTVKESVLNELKTKFRQHPGKVPIYLRINTVKHKGVQILVGEDLHVTVSVELMNDIKDIVGNEHFTVTF